MKSAMAMVLLLTLSIVAAADGVQSYRLLGKRISFSVDATWVKLEGQTDRVVAFQIPNPADQASPDSTNVAITADSNAAGSFQDRVQRLSSSAGSPITQLPTRPSSQDVLLLSRGKQGDTPYIIVDRLARRGAIEVAIRAAWPILESSTTEWQSGFLAQVNQLMAKVTVDGKPIGSVGHLVERTFKDDGNVVRTIEAEE